MLATDRHDEHDGGERTCCRVPAIPTGLTPKALRGWLTSAAGYTRWNAESSKVNVLNDVSMSLLQTKAICFHAATIKWLSDKYLRDR